MNIPIKDFHKALDLIGDAGGPEAEIVAQMALDLAVSVPFAKTPLTPEMAQKLLHQRIALYRAGLPPVGRTIH